MNPIVERTTKNQAHQSNFVQDFMRFKQSFTGDPKATVNQLLASGRITQDQLNQAVAKANQFKGLFGM